MVPEGVDGLFCSDAMKEVLGAAAERVCPCLAGLPEAMVSKDNSRSESICRAKEKEDGFPERCRECARGLSDAMMTSNDIFLLV